MRYNRGMRITRASTFLLVFLWMLGAATDALASEPPQQQTNVGTSDVCYDETVSIQNGALSEVPTKGANFSACEKVVGTCVDAQKKQLAGILTYADAQGSHRVSRCSPQAGRYTPANVNITPSAFKNLDPQSPTGQAKMTSMYQDLGVPQEQAQSLVQNNSQQAYDLLNNIANGNTSAAQEIGQQLNLDSGVLENIGQVQPIDLSAENPTAIGTQVLLAQSPSDQIRSVAASVCSSQNIQSCGQFQNNMVSTFNAECGGVPNCARAGSNVVGSFQQIPENYEQGLSAYLNACDPSTDSCQAVQSTCVNGAADRAVNLCSSAAAVGKNMSVERLIQSSYSDPQQQVAAHMLYQIAPGQFDAGAVNNIQTYTLNSASVSALCNGTMGQVCLAPGVTGGQAVSALGTLKNIQQGSVLTNTWVQIPGPAVASGGAQNTTASISSGPSIFGASYSPLSNMFGSLLFNPFSNLTNSLALNRSYQQQQASQTVPPPPTPTLSLSAQPSSVQHGQPISVSWTSSGMSTSAPCTVAQNGTTIGTGNAGATSTTPANAGTLVFRLVCQGATNGQVYEKSATASAQ